MINSRPVTHLSNPMWPVSIDSDSLCIQAGVRLKTPTATAALAARPRADWLDRIERMLELGAEAEGAFAASISVRLFEERLGELAAGLMNEIKATAARGGSSVEQKLGLLLREHQEAFVAQMMRFVDPSSDEAFPAILRGQLSSVTGAALKEISTLLSDPDEGALETIAKKLGKSVQDSERNILAQMAAKQAAANSGQSRGRTFEEAISAKLAQIATAMGCQVERCGDVPGMKRGKAGDHLITLDPGSTGGQEIRIVIEAKSRLEGGNRFSFEAVRSACASAKANRGAQAAIFVAATADCLPDAISFGQVGPSDFFVTFDPATGDDVGLTAGLYLARAAATACLSLGATGLVDIPAARQLVAEIRAKVERRTRILGYNNSALKAIHAASKCIDEDADAVLVSLRRLESIVVGK